MKINTDKLPTVGDVIASESDNEAGKILNAAISPDGNIEALAIMKIAEAGSTVTLADNTDAAITLLELPYSMDDE